MAYPHSLWSSLPGGGFPPSPQTLSALPPLVLDNAGYPSYPFDDPDKTYSPAEFASKFPAQPPKYTHGGRTSVIDCEPANVPSTSPERSGEYPGVHTRSYPAALEKTYPAAPDKTYPAAPEETYPSQQPQSVQDRRRPVIHFTRSVIALADSARSQDTIFDHSDLDHFPSTSSKPSGRTQRPPEVPTQSSYSDQLLRESVDRLTIASESAPPSHQGTYQTSSNELSSAAALNPSPLNTHQRCNLFGGQTSNIGEASGFGSDHSNITTTTQTSFVRRQAPVTNPDQPLTMTKLLLSVDSVNMEADSNNACPDSTTDMPTNVADEAAGPGDEAAGPGDVVAGPSNVAATPGNAVAGPVDRPLEEARIIKAALKCSHLVGAYNNLAPNESTKRRSPMYLDQPPPYLSDDEKDTYRTAYEKFIKALNGDLGTGQSNTGDKASHARLEMKGLWFLSRRRWEADNKPTVNFGISRVLRKALLKSTLAEFVTRLDDEDESDDESTGSALTELEEEGEKEEGKGEEGKEEEGEEEEGEEEEGEEEGEEEDEEEEGEGEEEDVDMAEG